jgi:hypothetical protein
MTAIMRAQPPVKATKVGRLVTVYAKIGRLREIKGAERREAEVQWRSGSPPPRGGRRELSRR